MGYSDTEPYGSREIRTPNLKRLAAEGTRFTNAYATAPVCVPSRAGLMTGRHQERFSAARKGAPLPVSEITFSELLRRSGYATAMAGKWHLGSKPELAPNARGFEEALAFYDWSIDYFSHRTRTGEPGLYENGKPTVVEGYSTDVFTDRAIAFMENKRTSPFFMYVSYNATLPPFQPPNRPGDIVAKDSGTVPIELWEKHGQPNARKDYIETVEALDDAVGRVLQAIDRLRIADNTIVVFTCDHGGMGPVRHAPLSHGFATLYEGGIRVPFLMRWPGRTKRAGIVSSTVSLLDLAPTFVAAAEAGGPSPAVAGFDGIDLAGVLRRGAMTPERSLYWREPFGGPSKAVRRGSWKYLYDGGDLLFNLDSDPGEAHNLALQKPELVAELKDSLARWETGLPKAGSAN